MWNHSSLSGRAGETSIRFMWIGGRYFEDCNEAAVLDHVTADASSGVAAYAVDPDNAKRLWELSLSLLRP